MSLNGLQRSVTQWSELFVGAVMCLEVLGEVVGAREALVADAARVRPDAGVRAPVPRQLVGPRERPRAARPRAGERLLAGVPANVRLEVRTLAVRLAAARVPARVYAVPAAAFRRQVPAAAAAAAAVGRRCRRGRRRRRRRRREARRTLSPFPLPRRSSLHVAVGPFQRRRRRNSDDRCWSVSDVYRRQRRRAIRGRRSVRRSDVATDRRRMR